MLNLHHKTVFFSHGSNIKVNEICTQLNGILGNIVYDVAILHYR